MWKINIRKESDNDFLIELPFDPFNEVVNHFKQVIETFSKIHSSVYCTSGIFLVKSYNIKNKKLSIHYHVDNDEELIRVTSVELE